MKAYVIMIIIVTIVNFFNERLIKKNNNKIKVTNYFLFGLSLFIICFITGIRNVNVGVDVKNYIFRLINVINESNSFISYIRNSNIDFLFSILVYFGYLFKNISILLFVIELAIALPIYIYAYNERNNVSFTLNILVFMLTMYCLSLSMMRQSISIALCILSYHYFKRNMKKTAWLILIISYLFHKTAFIFSIGLIIYEISSMKSKNRYFILFILIIILGIVTFFLQDFIKMSSYSYFLDYYGSVKSFSLFAILKKVLFVLLWIIGLNNNRKNENNTDMLVGFIFSLIAFYAEVMSLKYNGMGRLGYYFMDLSYFLLIKDYPRIFKQKRFITFLLVLLFIILWWHMTISDNISGIYPYYSDILPILN